MSKTPIYFAERNNGDNRKEKLIHPFDGRVIPLDPGLLKHQAQLLLRKFNLSGVDYILGLAEGGLIPAYAIAEASGIPFVGSYRVRLKMDNEIHFIEQHSERASHYIYGLRPGNTIIIIEDEITTGQTILNAIQQLNKYDITVKEVGAYLMNCNGTTTQRFQQLGYEVQLLFSQKDIQPSNIN